MNGKIELPSTYINYFDKYKILKYFSFEKEIKIKDNEQNNASILNEEKEKKELKFIKDSDIQIVSTLLKMYNNKTNGKKQPNLDSDKLIDSLECNNIISNCLIDNIK